MKLFDKIFNRRAQIAQKLEQELIPAAPLGDRQVISEVMAQNNDQLDILVKNQADFLSNGTPKKSTEEVIADKAILEIQNIMGADFDAKQLWQESGRNLLDEAIKTGSTDLIQQLLPHYSQLLLEPISTYEIREISVKDDLVFIKSISPLEQALRTQPAAMVKEFLELAQKSGTLNHESANSLMAYLLTDVLVHNKTDYQEKIDALTKYGANSQPTNKQGASIVLQSLLNNQFSKAADLMSLGYHLTPEDKQIACVYSQTLHPEKPFKSNSEVFSSLRTSIEAFFKHRNIGDKEALLEAINEAALNAPPPTLQQKMELNRLHSEAPKPPKPFHYKD